MAALSHVIGEGRVTNNRFVLLVRHIEQKDKAGWREDVSSYLEAYDDFRRATTVAHFLIEEEFGPIPRLHLLGRTRGHGLLMVVCSAL